MTNQTNTRFEVLRITQFQISSDLHVTRKGEHIILQHIPLSYPGNRFFLYLYLHDLVSNFVQIIYWPNLHFLFLQYSKYIIFSTYSHWVRPNYTIPGSYQSMYVYLILYFQIKQRGECCLASQGICKREREQPGM